jgi:DNA-binding CsgD family transcriptional regulator
MSQSARLRVADVQAIHKLAGQCRELGDDARTWRGHLAAGIGRLTGADLVFCVETAGCRDGQPVDLGVAEWGWDHGFDRAGWVRALVEFRHNPAYSLGLQRYFRRFAADDGVACSRKDLINDPEWERSFDREVIHQTIGVNHVAWCFRSLRGPSDEQAGVIATRQAGRRDFSPREKVILAETQAVIAPLVGVALARFAEPSPSVLPPRTRQVLRCLLEGDGDKHVAVRLGISPLTVNVHTKLIYRHFGVLSRAELLARWVRRGWSVGRWV